MYGDRLSLKSIVQSAVLQQFQMEEDGGGGKNKSRVFLISYSYQTIYASTIFSLFRIYLVKLRPK